MRRDTSPRARVEKRRTDQGRIGSWPTLDELLFTAKAKNRTLVPWRFDLLPGALTAFDNGIRRVQRFLQNAVVAEIPVD
jgi:hypothetical protein